MVFKFKADFDIEGECEEEVLIRIACHLLTKVVFEEEKEPCITQGICELKEI